MNYESLLLLYFLILMWAYTTTHTLLQAKKAGSQLKNRLVAEKPVAEWCRLIEEMEDQISTILLEEMYCYFSKVFNK